MLRKRKMGLISQWKSLLENVLLNIWGRSGEVGQYPLDYIVDRRHMEFIRRAIMDRAWNTFTHSFHPSYTWYNEILTDTNRYLFLLLSPFFKRNDNLCTDRSPFLSFSRYSFSRWLESQECHRPNFSRFSPLSLAESPFLFVQRNSSQCLPTIFLGFADNYGVSWDLMKRNLFLVCKNWKNSNICTVDFESLFF